MGAGMHSDLILEQIWGGAIEARSAGDMSPLARLLGALLTVPMVTLVAHAEVTRPFAMMETDELLPGAPLGDVLAEELVLDVPRDALVLIEPVGFADALSFSGRALGEELGRILNEIATDGGAQSGARGTLSAAGGERPGPALRALTRDVARILPEADCSPRSDERRVQ